MAKLVRGEKRGRAGKWLVDWRDHAGIRHNKTFDTKREAEDFYAEVLKTQDVRATPAVNVNIVVSDYATHWLASIRGGVKPATMASYQAQFARYINPALGTVRVRTLQRHHIKVFYVKLRESLSKASVKLVHATLSGMLTAAVDDGLSIANPADKLIKKLKLVNTKAQRQEHVRAMTRDQRDLFLDTARHMEADFYTHFLALFMMGIRLGESLGLEWDDLETDKHLAHIRRTVDDKTGAVGTPKGGKSRDVDMNGELIAALRRWKVQQAEKSLREGRGGELPTQVFPMPSPRSGADLVRAVFKRVLKKAGLPDYFSPHCCRHTYASILLSEDGGRLIYVQEQLGHAGIQETVDTYGKWLRKDGRGAVDTLCTKGFKAAANT